ERPDSGRGRVVVIGGGRGRGGRALERARAGAEPAGDREPIWPATGLERLVSIGLSACARAFQGDFAAADASLARCQRLADARADASARAAEAFYRALVAQTRGDWAAAVALADEAIGHARAAANLIYEYVGHVYLGLALARQGRIGDGLAVQQAAFGLAERAQTRVILGRAHAWLGEILLLDGRAEEA